MSKTRFTLATTVALTTVITLAACSTTSGSPVGANDVTNGPSPASSSPSNAGVHNDADIAFAMGMVPHHQQAVEMADVILGKSGIDPQVTALATKIKDAQAPEITRMTGWLDTWGSPLDSMGNMPGMDHGTGMMSNDDMGKLDTATGKDASKLFLQQMIQHHQGAIEMANLEVSGGADADALEMARNIVKSQTAEIADMKSLLASL